MSAPNPVTKTLIIERELSHPPEKVWRALTQAPLLEQWLLANDFIPVVGHKFNLRAAPMQNWDGVIQCEVLEVNPFRRLSYKWESIGLQSVVTWILTQSAMGTLARMEQSGFRSDQENNHKGASFGWQRFLGQLERVLDQLG